MCVRGGVRRSWSNKLFLIFFVKQILRTTIKSNLPGTFLPVKYKNRNFFGHDMKPASNIHTHTHRYSRGPLGSGPRIFKRTFRSLAPTSARLARRQGVAASGSVNGDATVAIGGDVVMPPSVGVSPRASPSRDNTVAIARAVPPTVSPLTNSPNVVVGGVFVVGVTGAFHWRQGVRVGRG